MTAYIYKVHYRTGRGALCGGGPGRARNLTDVVRDVTCSMCRDRIPVPSPALAWITKHGVGEPCPRMEAARGYWLAELAAINVGVQDAVESIIATCVAGHDGASAVLREFRGLLEAKGLVGPELGQKWERTVLQAVARCGMPGERPECSCPAPADEDQAPEVQAPTPGADTAELLRDLRREVKELTAETNALRCEVRALRVALRERRVR